MQSLKDKIHTWRNGADGFLQWVADVKPRILTGRNKWEVFTPAPFQEQMIREALQIDSDGQWRYGTVVICWPRRHSKTTMAALIAIWRFSLWPNENIVAVANTENQIISTGFKQVHGIISNTPFLRQQIGEKNIQKTRIDYPALQSSIRTVTTNIASLYGEKISVGWVTEIHAAPSTEPMEILLSSLADTQNSLMLIDSTTDGIGGPLHDIDLKKAAGSLETTYVNRVEYRDFEDAAANSPLWINRTRLKEQYEKLPPLAWASQHLNQRKASSSNLFRVEDIEKCMDAGLPHPITMQDLQRITAGKTFVCGAGYDRASTGSLHADNTIWSVVAKVAEPDSDPHYYILHEADIFASLGFVTKKTILSDHKQYKLVNATLEHYSTQDLSVWAADQGIPHEVVYPTSQAQQPAFLNLHQIVKEGRLHFSDKLQDLKREMEVFPYEIKNGVYRFGKSKKHHDDRVFALCWAIHSLRQEELAAYTLNSIVCTSKSRHAGLCYLRNGDLILPCSSSCLSHRQTQAMFNSHTARNVDSDLTLPEFFNRLVVVKGARVYRDM